MKKNEIVKGGLYTAKVNNVLTTVRVKEVYESRSMGASRRVSTHYTVENTATGRQVTFRSAVKFLRPATTPTGKPRVSPHPPLATTQAFAQARQEAQEAEPETNTFTTSADDLQPGEASELMAPELAAAKSRAAETQAPVACPECGSEDVVQDGVSTSSCRECEAAFANVDARRSAPKPAPRPSFVENYGGPAKTLPAAKPSVLAGVLSAAKAREEQGPPHLVVVARAGSGKTTTIIEGTAALRGLPTTITPSVQQQAIWDAMGLSRDARTIGMVCFNKSIATVLQEKLASRGLASLGCEAMTLHSLGNKAVGKSFGWLKVNEYRVRDIIAEITETPIRELWREKPTLIQATQKLVSLVKMNLANLDPCGNRLATDDADWAEVLDALVAHYDVDVNHSRREIYDLVPQVIERCLDVTRDKCLDFDDMVWLPVALNLPVFKHDLLLVDESQDLNRCQQALAKKAGRRLVFVGDDKQAIYGFAGADAESIDRLKKELAETLRGCTVLPLTMTRRCGRAIVEEARTLVSDFEAHESNPDGKVSTALFPRKVADGPAAPKVEWEKSYGPTAKDGDLVLCRVNAPLVSQCFQFLRRGVKATIQGRDIGAGLVKLVEKLGASSVPDLVAKLGDWLAKETDAENAKRNPLESRLIALQDRHDCLMCFTEDQTTVEGVVRRITDIFTDDRNGAGVKLSSVHKAKGMEADRVFLLRPKGASIPHPMAKGTWQLEQEMNILYVAVTRAIHSLVYVS